MSAKKRTTPATTDNSLSPSIKWYGNPKFCLVFKESCLIQKITISNSLNRIKLFTVYELDTWSWDLYSDYTLKDCLFGGVKLAKNAYLDKHVYNGYGIGFDSRRECLLPDDRVGRNVIIFGIDMSSSVHIDNKRKGVLIIGIG